MHHFKLTLTKIVAARCDFHAQYTPKFVCGRRFAPNPTGGVYSASPGPLAGFRGGKGKKEKGRGRKEGKGREGTGSIPPLLQFYHGYSDEREKIAAAMTNVCAI